MTAPPRLPELFHIGWVVRDCAAAQEELSARLGAGPFVSTGDELRFDHVLVDGKPTPVSLRVAFGNGVLDHDAVAGGLDLLADLLRLDLVEGIALAERLARLPAEPDDRRLLHRHPDLGELDPHPQRHTGTF